ncbi:MAG: BatD protein [Flavobacteriales bacterium]|nr:MAG: BatD protein [Flavobacteriales bacterium]
MLSKLNIVLFIIGLNQIMLAQDLSFKTSVSKDRLGVNERLRITFTINKQGGDNFTPPDFKNFRVLAGPMQGTSFSDFNGKKTFEQSYTYTIEPKKQGVFTIPSASITYEGNVIKTNTVKITVTKAVEIPKDPNDPNYIASQNIHLVAELSNTNPYVGESISVVYKLYVDVTKVRVNHTREIEPPTFSGFWNQEIEVKQWDAQEGTFQGKPHKYAVMKKVVLIPQKAGKLTINPMELELSVGIPIGRRDLRGFMINNTINYNISTGQRTIDVKPLPEKNKPIDFTGAVGDFDFKVTANKTELAANESAQIKVEVSGKGNLKLITLPEIVTPEGLEKFNPEHKEQINTYLSGFRGSVYDEYTVVPQYRGKYKIPPLSFTYFSLKNNSYKTITTNPIVINAPFAKPQRGIDNTNVVAKQDVIDNAKDIRYIATTANLTLPDNRTDFFKSTVFYTLLALPVLAIPLGMFIGFKKRQRDEDVVGNKRRKADRMAKKYLFEAKKQLGNKEAFYEALEKALHNYLKAKLNVTTTDISKERIRELLTARKVKSETTDAFLEVFKHCEYARYTPTTQVEMQAEYERAKAVIVKMDKEL